MITVMSDETTTMIRIPISIHKALKVAAAAAGKSTAQYVADVLTPTLKTSAGAPYLPNDRTK
ncbi:HicB family protein [Dehalogenimonas formicexedens]|uniref:HicB family protein n=2 Tax=Dehalogenimonas formicexedens TaxID=1839801 RepID=A0A1P8F6S3_9CHLR|nr:HicB family protein [Dehalogenimonas formicexedens]